MRISQCLIVKNEEKNIGHCLSHLKDIVDEQIVVDTGSTDRTVEIAKEMGAKVFHFEWINDFSAARNYALSKSKGDWIIFLDADEHFTEESTSYIRPAIIECVKLKDIDGIICELINMDKSSKTISVVKNISPRIFKKIKSVKYVNKIHEILYNEKRPEYNYALLSVDCGDKLKIIHTGYDKDVMKKKSERYIDMLKSELDKNPDDSHYNLYFSNIYYIDGQLEKSLEHAKKSMKCMHAEMEKGVKKEYYCSIYSTVMYVMMAMNEPYEEIKEIFERAIISYPEYPDYYKIIGIISLRDDKIQESIDNLEKCINLCKSYKGNVESLALGTINEVYKNLLDAYNKAHNLPKIVEIAVALLNSDKYDYVILTILINTFLSNEKEESIIQFLTKIYDYSKFKDKIYLLKASEASKNKVLINFYKSLLSDKELEVIKNFNK